MPRQRMIHPDLWDNDAFLSYPIPQRLLWIALVSLADDYGRGRASSRWWAGRVFPFDSMPDHQIEAYLKSLEKDGRLVLYFSSEKVRLYQLTNWEKFQKVRFPKDSQFPAPDPRIADRITANRGSENRESRISDRNKLDQVSINKALLSKSSDSCKSTNCGKPVDNSASSKPNPEGAGAEGKPQKGLREQLGALKNSLKLGSALPAVLQVAENADAQAFYGERDPDLIEALPIEWRAPVELVEARKGGVMSRWEWDQIQLWRYKHEIDPSWMAWAIQQTLDREPRIERPVEYACAVLRRCQAEGMNLKKAREEGG